MTTDEALQCRGLSSDVTAELDEPKLWSSESDAQSPSSLHVKELPSLALQNDAKGTTGEGQYTEAPTWRPFFLQQSTLLLILALFVLELIGILALYIHSELHDGILQVPEQNHLLWKYGPTACTMDTCFLRPWRWLN